MLRKILLFCSLFIFALAWGQEKTLSPSPMSLQAFDQGEWFEFRIHYGVFNASQVTLGITADTLNQVPVFHAKGYGKTTGLARLFFKVEDYYESYFSQNDGLPQWFIRNINEGGYKKNVEIRFDHENSNALVEDKKRKKKSTHEINPKAQDLISAFYYLRNFYDTKDLKKGDVILLNMFFDQENYPFKLVCLGRETLETKFGKVKCVKMQPYVQSGRVFKAQESVTLWVSDDANKIPVRMRADLRVGAIDCDLENFKNLKNPFVIQVD